MGEEEERGKGRIMELKDTVQMMTSADWKERFRAEYFQLEIRSRGLKRMLDNWDNLDFTPNCPKGLLIDQYNAMDKYLAILKDRAAIEGIEVEE